MRLAPPGTRLGKIARIAASASALWGFGCAHPDTPELPPANANRDDCPIVRVVEESVRPFLAEASSSRASAPRWTVERHPTDEFADPMIRRLPSPVWVAQAPAVELRLPEGRIGWVTRRMSIRGVVDPESMMLVRIDFQSTPTPRVPEPSYEWLLEQLSIENNLWLPPQSCPTCCRLDQALRETTSNLGPSRSAELIIARRVSWDANFQAGWLKHPRPLQAWLIDYRGIEPIPALTPHGISESFMWYVDALSCLYFSVSNTPKPFPPEGVRP